MDADEILKVCALSRLNAPETKAEHHAYTTARQTLSSLVERIGSSDRSREPGPAPEGADAPSDATPADPAPAAAPAGGEELRADEPRSDDLADCLAEVAPEIRARLLLVPPIL